MIFKQFYHATKIFIGNTLINSVKYANELVYTSFQMIYKYFTPPFEFFSSGDDIDASFMLYGNTVQNGIPTLSNPVEIYSVAGEHTSNLIDITKMSSENIEVNEANKSFDVFGSYAVSAGITVPEFFRMSGLQAGDKITVVADIESIAGSGGNYGSITLLSRDTTKAQSVNLLPYGKRIHTLTLPEDLNHTNHYASLQSAK